MSSIPFAADPSATPLGAAGSNTRRSAPLYQQIKGLILQSLQQGEWKPGEAIPSEMELAAAFASARAPCAKAIAELAAENLVSAARARARLWQPMLSSTCSTVF